jgi:hypothetical protein
MYVRIARFENTDGNWEERIEEVSRRMRGDGDTPIGRARGAVKRAIMLADREHHRGAGLIFCETARGPSARRRGHGSDDAARAAAGGRRSRSTRWCWTTSRRQPA